MAAPAVVDRALRKPGANRQAMQVAHEQREPVDTRDEGGLVASGEELGGYAGGKSSLAGGTIGASFEQKRGESARTLTDTKSAELRVFAGFSERSWTAADRSRSISGT